MTDQAQATGEELDWDSVLGSVEKQEKEDKKEGKGDFEALPKGPYEIVVQSAEKQVSSSGNDMIKVQLQVVSGPYANRILFSYIVFSKGSPKAMRITLEKLASFGLTREYIATTKPSIPEIAGLLEGRRAVATVAIQETGEYKGSNEVKGFRKSAVADQAAPVAVEAKPAGVPNIPKPEAAAPIVTPVIPLPEVPVGAADAADPFAE